MNLQHFRRLGLAMAAATLCLGFAACDDDTGTGTVDSGVKTDGGADMAATVPATAQVTFLELEGFVFTTGQDGGTNMMTAYESRSSAPVHLLAPTVDLPTGGTGTQHSDPDPLHGCSWSRYSTTTPPAGNRNAGVVSFSGYNNTMTQGYYAANSTKVNGTGLVDASITCAYSDTLKGYSCFYGTDPAAAVTKNTLGVIFPPAPSGTAPFYTSQSVLAKGSTVTENIAGSAEFDMISKMVTDTPDFLKIVKIESGATDITAMAAGGDLSFIPSTAFDGNNDLKITWSCDGSATAGAGCDIYAGNIVALAITTNPMTRGLSALNPYPTDYGSATCVDGPNNTTHSITVKAQVIKDILTGQTGGSARIVLAHVTATIGSSKLSNARVFFTAGRGRLGFVNMP